MGLSVGWESKGKRLVKKLINLARRLRPPKKVIAYAIRKELATLWGRRIASQTLVRFWVTFSENNS
jgi:hypothetical protein